MFKEKVHSVLILLLLVAIVTSAQTPTAVLSGIVRDEQKGGVPGATVKVREVATGKTRAVMTDGEGRYSFTNLAPGGYELRIEASGYKVTVQNGLALTVGGSAGS